LKSPLAYFRGFQIASGVGLKMPPLQEAVLRRYFYKDRLAKIAEAEAISQAMISTATKDGNAADKAFRRLKGILFPELAEETEDFATKSKPIMDAWRTRVWSLEPVKVGKKGIGAIARIHKLADVIDEIRKIKPIPKEMRRPNPYKQMARKV
jgi:hypothetical protein